MPLAVLTVAAHRHLSIFPGHRVSTCVAKTYAASVLASVTPILTRNQIRDFVQRFYSFVEGVSQHHRNVDELLSKVSRYFPVPKDR